MRVFQGDANRCRARLFTEQTADVSHCAGDFGVQFRRADGDRFAHLHLVQVLGRNAECHPHPGQIRERERVAGFVDHLPRRQVFFHHHAVERCAQLITIAASGNHAAAEHANFLSRIVQGDFSLFQCLTRLEEILFG
ncbi:hypothetical protein D3C84_278440 [compost metagenome]